MATTERVKVPDMQVVYEKHDQYDEHAGPYGSERIGVRIGDRVIWLGAITYPWGNTAIQEEYENAKRLAKQLASISNLVEALEKIANDFVPENESQLQIALDEMRSCAEEALAAARGEQR